MCLLFEWQGMSVQACASDSVAHQHHQLVGVPAFVCLQVYQYIKERVVVSALFNNPP